MTNMIHLSFFLCLVCSLANADDVGKSESDLRRSLFDDYDKLVRPVAKTTDTIPVAVNLVPVGLREVDVKDRSVKFDSWLFVRWEDQYLRWDPAEFGINHLIIPSDAVWRPDISLYTAISDEGLLPTVMTNVVVFNNGTVLWVPPFTVRSRCPPTENQITGDTFQCTVQLGSWTYHNELLNVHELHSDSLSRVSAESFYNNHPKWILESMSASTEQKKYECCENLYPVVKFDMRFRKRVVLEPDD